MAQRRRVFFAAMHAFQCVILLLSVYNFSAQIRNYSTLNIIFFCNQNHFRF